MSADDTPWDSFLRVATTVFHVDAPLAGLARLRAARVLLDDAERRLIDHARNEGATWGQVAAALNLTSRQAAEQRRARLERTARSRSHSALEIGSAVAAVRCAALALIDAIVADEGWTGRFPRAALARDTLRAAASAPPGPLFDLVAQALADVDDEVLRHLPAGVRAGFEALRRAVREARPTSLAVPRDHDTTES